MLGASSDDDGVPRLRRLLYDKFGELQNAFAVDDFQLVGVEAALVTAAQE